ncbi:LysR substrate-binding domain-containing protein [Novosphingobium rosa]|uniref:LysR substrate-binding domain-containing protein n=1 Tax=Novosphingobium rosa TaxID=76978 RepID=UPI00083627FE|nr:LysR substrate-binding domain-containing protein [Novosphingobium rosa]
MDQDDRRLLPSITMLQCFEAAARYGSASLAGERIGLTQSAVSRHIASLETWLGKPLFDRVGRRIVLNENGRLYLDRIARPLSEIRAATRDMLGHGSGRVVNLATLPTFGMRWIAPRLPGLLMHDPDLVVNIAARIDIFNFAEEAFDAAIHVGPPDWPEVEHDLLFRERVIPVLSPALAQSAGVKAAQDFLRVPLLEQSARRDAWQKWFALSDVPFPAERAVSVMGHFSMLAQAACAGAGAALLPSFLIQPELQSGALVAPVERALAEDRNYYLVYPKAKLQMPHFVQLRDWLLDEAAKEVSAEYG